MPSTPDFGLARTEKAQNLHLLSDPHWTSVRIALGTIAFVDVVLQRHVRTLFVWALMTLFQTDSQTLPLRALVHQEAVEGAVSTVFGMPAASFDAMRQGGSRVLEKVVRAYHYWATEHQPRGICPYDHPRIGYFRMTPLAHEADATEPLHCEHVVPIRQLVAELCRVRGDGNGPLPIDEVRRVMRSNEVVVTTKAEAKLLDKRFRFSMPDGWTFADSHLRRLELVLGISESELCGIRLVGPSESASIGLNSK